jgi:hypothetical protein
MNIKLVWDNEEKTILRYVYAKGWNWVDFREAVKEAGVMLDTVKHKVNIIMDFREASMIPSGAITEAQRAFANQRHPNINITVLVGSSFVHRLAEVGSKLARTKAGNWELAFTNTLDQAYKLIKDNTDDKTESSKGNTDDKTESSKGNTDGKTESSVPKGAP